jgi:hypothetical protein
MQHAAAANETALHSFSTVWTSFAACQQAPQLPLLLQLLLLLLLRCSHP